MYEGNPLSFVLNQKEEVQKHQYCGEAEKQMPPSSLSELAYGHTTAIFDYLHIMSDGIILMLDAIKRANPCILFKTECAQCLGSTGLCRLPPLALASHPVGWLFADMQRRWSSVHGGCGGGALSQLRTCIECLKLSLVVICNPRGQLLPSTAMFLLALLLIW